MKFTKLLVFLLFIAAGSAWGQGPNPGIVQAGKGAIIYGKIIDKASNKTMQYANIALFSKKDSSLIGGGITNEQGIFSIPNVANGDYYLEAKFVGYRKKIISSIAIVPGLKRKDLGTIHLSPAANELNSVEVVARQPRVEYKIDKKVINVAQDVNATG